MKLVKGKGNGIDTACLLSAASLKAGLKFSDMPECVCPTIRAVSIRLNDHPWWRDDEERTAILGPLVDRIIGTAGSPKLQAKRANLAVKRASTYDAAAYTHAAYAPYDAAYDAAAAYAHAAHSDAATHRTALIDLLIEMIEVTE